MPGPRLPFVPRVPIRPVRPVAPTPVSPPPVAPPIARPPIAQPPIAAEPAYPDRDPPPGLDSKELAAWHLAKIHEHHDLRQRSFYDTGKHIEALLALRALYGAKNIKELCSKAKLGMSHMTANKYLQVVRAFDRATAIEVGVDKCYALTGYAKAIGRKDEAAAILAADEPVRGVRGLRAKDASASKLFAAVSELKKRAREAAEPQEFQARKKRAAESAEKWVRKLGFRAAQAEIVRRGGEARVAIYISLEIAEQLESRVIGALAKVGPRLAKSQPDLFEPLFDAGWKLKRTG